MYNFLDNKLRKLKQDWSIQHLMQQKNDLEYIEEHGLWELKITVPNKEFRMLGVLREENSKKPIYYTLHCFWKKDQQIRKQAFITAKSRLQEFNY